VTTWIKLVIEVPLATISAAGGSSFWSLSKLPKYLNAVMSTASNLETLQLTQFTGVIKIDPGKEAKIGYTALLYSDVSSSLSAWRTTKYISLAFVLLIFVVSFFLGIVYLAVNVVAFVLSSFMEIQTSAQGNVFRDVQVMLGRIDRWMKADPEGCRKYCMETNPKYFREMFLSVEKRNL
jgi:hypothetical protein